MSRFEKIGTISSTHHIVYSVDDAVLRVPGSLGLDDGRPGHPGTGNPFLPRHSCGGCTELGNVDTELYSSIGKRRLVKVIGGHWRLPSALSEGQW